MTHEQMTDFLIFLYYSYRADVFGQSPPEGIVPIGLFRLPFRELKKVRLSSTYQKQGEEQLVLDFQRINRSSVKRANHHQHSYHLSRLHCNVLPVLCQNSTLSTIYIKQE